MLDGLGVDIELGIDVSFQRIDYGVSEWCVLTSSWVLTLKFSESIIGFRGRSWMIWGLTSIWDWRRGIVINIGLAINPKSVLVGWGLTPRVSCPVLEDWFPIDVYFRNWCCMVWRLNIEAGDWYRLGWGLTSRMNCCVSGSTQNLRVCSELTFCSSAQIDFETWKLNYDIDSEGYEVGAEWLVRSSSSSVFKINFGASDFSVDLRSQCRCPI